MNSSLRHHILLALLLILPAAAQELTTATLDAGGGLTNGGEVEIAGSLGGFGGIADGSDATTARAGFPGQIYDPALVAISPGEATLAERETATFTAEVVCDDGTILPNEPVAWSVDSPLLEVSASGEVTTGLLPYGFTALLTASAAGVTGTATLTLFDGNHDDFGSYASDKLPDDWQVSYFGFENPDAAPGADPDSDGQNNLTEYRAGTDPTDANSFLQLFFAAGPPPPGTRVLQFAPSLPDRLYTLESSATLNSDWTPLPGVAVPAAMPGEGVITDAAAADSRQFYRLRITVP